MDLIAGPSLEDRAVQHTLGIRVIAPFRGMLAERDRLLAELIAQLSADGIVATSFFLRLHVIDMAGPMDIEVGATVAVPAKAGGRLRPGTLPAGRYATLTYKDHALRANRALIDWAAAKGIEFDHTPVPLGDAFACRYELYVTDPRVERRKTRWIVQLNFLTRPGGSDAKGSDHG